MKVPIVRRISNKNADSVPLPENVQDITYDGRCSHKVRVSRSIILEPQRKTFFTVTTSLIGLMEIQPLQALYDKHAIVSMNGIVDVLPNVPFEMLLANYSEKRYLIPKIQTVGYLLP